jgi:osmoprotectant transport system substrate-binding protein
MLVFAAACLVGACGGASTVASSPTADDAIRVAAFNFPESVLLAEIYAQALEDAGFPVARMGAVGSREVVEPALELGVVDVVPEYLGSLLEFVNLGAGEASADSTASLARLRAALAERGMVALAPADAQDRNALVVRQDFVIEHRVREVSDLVPLGPDLTFGGPSECPERFFCLVGLAERYGLEFGAFVPMPGSRVVVDALRAGEIDVGLLFSTEAELTDPELVVLVDDGGLQPAENVVPVLRQEVLDRWGPGVRVALDAVSGSLDTVTLVTLNFDTRATHTDEQPDVAAVVADWLAERGLTG